ncbi:septum formation family protein, partial [Micromonospora zhanjiangensis]
DWRTGRLALSVLVPQAEAWAGGARWFRCDLSEVESLDNDKPVPRAGSLRGALTAGSPLAYGCFNPKLIKDDINFMDPISCDKPHHAEFAGLYLAPDTPLAAFVKDAAAAHRSCMRVIARYAGLPDNPELGFRVGSIFYHPDEQGWLAGNRGVQCFLWVDDRTLTRSMKGAGPSALPVN